MEAILNVEVENAIESLLETYELVTLYGDEDSKDIVPYLEHMEALCNIKYNAARADQALKLAMEQHDMNDFRRVYNEELNKPTKFKGNGTARYKVFQTRINERKDFGVQITQSDITKGDTSRMECDEFVMETQINDIDPLTKLRMKDPVVNALCGHHYERSSILESIKINRRLRCPVAGCANNQFIQAQHLKSDNVLKMRLLQTAQNENEDPLAE